jgi:hypothetical protein
MLSHGGGSGTLIGITFARVTEEEDLEALISCKDGILVLHGLTNAIMPTATQHIDTSDYQ